MQITIPNQEGRAAQFHSELWEWKGSKPKGGWGRPRNAQQVEGGELAKVPNQTIPVVPAQFKFSEAANSNPAGLSMWPSLA